MAGGGVGEAMLIGAAVGAGTGGIMSAAQDKDPLEGALLGAAMGAAGGGIGSGIGGLASGGTQAATQAATQAGTQAAAQGGAQLGTAATTEAASQLGQQTVSNLAQQGAQQASTSMAAMPNLAANQAATSALAEGSSQLAGQSWGAQGLGQGFAPSLTNAQAYGAGAGGGIMGLIGQSSQMDNNFAPEPDPYTGSLSYFKYNPQTFRPSVAPGYADGGIASIGPQGGMYPQSQYDKTQFATPTQIPTSREVVGADYDARINPYTGDMMMASGGISHLGSYSDGGRLLKGPGDGMSDDIPASIADKQPARLADGEFVVPADVVSHLGNGSTDSGAKKLYAMMDNVRKARTGNKKQGKQIKADKYIPGMADGGIASFQEGGETEMPLWFSNYLAEQQSAPKPGMGAVSGQFQPTGYTPTERQYTPYTMANRPSSTEPQYYQDIYRPAYSDFSTPGYTLAGNLGQWSNVAGEQQRAMQPASMNQQITQSYLQNLGRAPETEGMNYWLQSGMTAPQIDRAIQRAPEAYNVSQNNPSETDYISGLYQQYLGRAPKAEGLEYWGSKLGNEMNAQQLVEAIQGSEEGKAYAAKQAAPKEEKKRRGGIASLV